MQKKIVQGANIKKIINITVCYMCSYKPTRLCYVVGVLGLIGGETT